MEVRKKTHWQGVHMNPLDPPLHFSAFLRTGGTREPTTTILLLFQVVKFAGSATPGCLKSDQIKLNQATKPPTRQWTVLLSLVRRASACSAALHTCSASCGAHVEPHAQYLPRDRGYRHDRRAPVSNTSIQLPSTGIVRAGICTQETASLEALDQLNMP
jgi:hypothetical protein